MRRVVDYARQVPPWRRGLCLRYDATRFLEYERAATNICVSVFVCSLWDPMLQYAWAHTIGPHAGAA